MPRSASRPLGPPQVPRMGKVGANQTVSRRKSIRSQSSSNRSLRWRLCEESISAPNIAWRLCSSSLDAGMPMSPGCSSAHTAPARMLVRCSSCQSNFCSKRLAIWASATTDHGDKCFRRRVECVMSVIRSWTRVIVCLLGGSAAAACVLSCPG